jgi:GNAT superfamily N-acetyltransferase
MDANVFIAVEPYSGATETNLAPAARLLRLAAEQGHQLFVHPAVADDLREGTQSDRERAKQRLAELSKYQMLTESPISSALVALAGSSDAGTNDHRDLRLLAALHSRAVTYLVSEDAGLRKRAVKAGLGDAVLTVAEAVTLLAQLIPRTSEPPPRVRVIPTYALDVEQPIFDTIRGDYSPVEFDPWLDRVRADAGNRTCLVVDHDATYAGIALLKREPECDYALTQPVMKISTFKVDEGFAGSKYGELLLKAIFQATSDEGTATLYVEVLPRHELLVQLFLEFGFEDSGPRTPRGELVLAKRLRPGDEAADVNDLEYHVRYGPPALRVTRAFAVPIQPRWHEQLFPDAPDLQLMLDVSLASPHPWGNALRKAYLTQSRITKLVPGDVLLFYRSQDASAVTAAGIVERTLRSANPDEIVTFVGRRTVYTPDEISRMCASVAPPLAILFRQDRFIDPPWALPELEHAGVLTTWPQSITQIREEGIEWIRTRLGASR